MFQNIINDRFNGDESGIIIKMLPSREVELRLFRSPESVLMPDEGRGADR
jgi:hypothetical protein